jgi:hypothetical protein
VAPRAAAQQQPGPQPQPQPQPRRRSVLLRGSALPLAPLLAQAAIGTDDAKTLVNSVLSAYGGVVGAWVGVRTRHPLKAQLSLCAAPRPPLRAQP